MRIYRDLAKGYEQRGQLEGQVARQEMLKRDEQNAFNRQRQSQQDEFNQEQSTRASDLRDRQMELNEQQFDWNKNIAETRTKQEKETKNLNDQFFGMPVELRDDLAKLKIGLSTDNPELVNEVMNSERWKNKKVTPRLSQDGGMEYVYENGEVIKHDNNILNMVVSDYNKRRQNQQAEIGKVARDLQVFQAKEKIKMQNKLFEKDITSAENDGGSGGTRSSSTGRLGPVTSNGTMWAEVTSALGYDLDDVGSFDDKDNTKFVFHSKIAQTIEHVRKNNPGLSDNEIIEIAMKHNDVNSVSGDDYYRQKLQSEYEERKSTVNEIEQALARVRKARASKDVSPEDAKYYTLDFFGQHGLLPVQTALTKKLLGENKQRIKEIEDAYVEMDKKKAKVQGVHDMRKANELKKITLSVKDFAEIRSDLVKLVDAHKAGKNPSQETINAMINKYRKAFFNRYNDIDFYDAAMKEVEWLFKQAGGGKLPSKNLKADEEAPATPATKKDLSK